MRMLVALFSVLVLLQSTAAAEDINQIFTKVNQLVEEGNFPKAIEELAWAKNELEKMHFKKLGELLPANLAGFTGKEVKSQSAMGFQTIERQYQKDSEQIRLTLTGGSAAGSQGGLAALGRMAAMMGNQPGSDTFRVDGRTASLTTRNKRSELSVFLESGSVLKMELRNSENPEQLKQAVEQIDIAALDTYLKGSK